MTGRAVSTDSVIRVWDIKVSRFNILCDLDGEGEPLSPSPSDKGNNNNCSLTGLLDAPLPGNNMDNEDSMESDPVPVPVPVTRKRGHGNTEDESTDNTKANIKTYKNTKATKKKITLKNTKCEDFLSTEKSVKDTKSSELQRQPNNSSPNTIKKPQGNTANTPIPVKKNYAQEAEGSDYPQRYDAHCVGPYIIYVRKPSNNKDLKNQLPTLTLAKKLYAANIKFSNINNYSYNTWAVDFSSKNLANNALANPIIKEMGFSLYVPRFKISRKIVIRQIPLEFNLEELQEMVKMENPKIKIINIFRLKTRNRTTRQLQESETVCLEIRGERIPESFLF